MLGRIALLVFGVLSGLTLLEGFLRAGEYLANSSGSASAVRRSPADTSASGPPKPVVDFRDMFALARPNLDGLLLGKPFSTNSHGYRSPEPRREKTPSLFRIAVVGDSVTMGHGVGDEETYSRLLADHLNRVSDGIEYEVLNLGLNGLPIDAIVDQRVFVRARKLEPDMIVYGYTLNDLEPLAAYRGKELREPPMHRHPAPFGLKVLKEARDSLAYWREILAPHPGTYVWELDENYLRNPVLVRELEDYFHKLATFGGRSGICKVVFLHAEMHELGVLHPFHRYYDVIAAAARKAGLPVIRSIDHFKGLDASELRVSRSDSHPNAKAHQILAEALADGLRTTIPQECFDRRWSD